ncbi:MAG: hydantoinase/oxoprolinase family protein [Methylobacteriaceae bacterium]|nr:hydantoinase/oxoprolinase family protein [Methylobacteriaceae bacterium]
MDKRSVLGIDVGGTFTDFVAYDFRTNAIKTWKEPSTPDDPVEGIVAGLKRNGDCDAIANVRIGTTVATNALLERKGATIAYVTTKGFRDVPFIQRGNRRAHYDMSWVKPKPLVRRRHCFELSERIDAYGEVVIPLDEVQVRAVAAAIRAVAEIEAVAVCLLFSYLNPTHELRVRDILAGELPGKALSISYDVLPKWKEYERASTTIADAYLKPVVGRRLKAMRGRLDETGLTAPAVIIRSNGGEMTLEAASEAPVQMVLSGPTGGVIASRFVADELGIDNLVTIDMGGTSTDVSTVIGRKESFTTAFEIEWGVPIQVPMIDIRSIGAGGGSIAWIDKGGMLRVGPQSAGARPGPACYGRGGTEPTVTDANLVLGRINPDNFLGGRMQLDVEAARRAVAKLAAVLGTSLEDTALAMVRIVDNNMIGALRSVLIERGLDPRDFTLCAFGGATPLHASALMREMGIPRAVVPIHPAQFSAYGFIMTNPRVDRQRTTQLISTRFDVERANKVMDELVGQCVAELAAQGYTHDIEVHRALEMRYLGQNYELELPLAIERFEPGATEKLWALFHDTHKARFGFSTPGEIIEIVNYSVTAMARTARPALTEFGRGEGEPKPKAQRPVSFLGGPRSVPVFTRADLLAGQIVRGPALVEEEASVTVLDAGYRLTVHPCGHLLIDVEG